VRLFERKIQRHLETNNKKKGAAVVGLRALFTPLATQQTPGMQTLQTSASMPVLPTIPTTSSALHMNAHVSIVNTTASISTLLALDDSQAKVLKYAQSFGGSAS
jgi:hypothetical protein